jgi:hypothetical protein
LPQIWPAEQSANLYWQSREKISVILLPRSYIRCFIGITCLLVATLWSGGSLFCIGDGHFPKNHKKCCSEDCDAKPNKSVDAESFFSAVSRVACSCIDDTAECCCSISLSMIAQRRVSQRDQSSPIKVHKAYLTNSMSDASASEKNARGMPHQPHYCVFDSIHDRLQTTVLLI